MVLYATDHERQLIVAALSFYAQHLATSPALPNRSGPLLWPMKSKQQTGNLHRPGGADERQ